jgi:transcriptional regulator with XRE-family HTH domain
MKELGKRITQLRKERGLSQEKLVETDDINLRTLQRIEKGETEPHGDTLQRLTTALNVTFDEIFDFTKEENTNYIGAMHFSILIFILFPLGNIILPLILWLIKRDKIKGLSDYGRHLLNFQITWSIFAYFPHVYYFLNIFFDIPFPFPLRGMTLLYYLIIMYVINILYTLVAGIASIKGYKNLYPIAIRFIRT